MSFSSKVKNEICAIPSPERHCGIAEIVGIVNTCGVVGYFDETLTVRIQTENASVAKRFFTLTKAIFNTEANVSIKKNTQFNKNRTYTITINRYQQLEKLLLATGIMTIDGNIIDIRKRISSMVVKNECCKRAYIRGAFLSGGSLSDPEKGYHLEFINTNQDLAVSLSLMINHFGLNSKVILRKGYYVVYLKEGENIVDLLNIMGAHLSLMNLENVRILKEMRNKVNRIVNCETANLGKTVDAAVNQLEDIKFISQNKGLEFLSDQLLEVAILRVENPEASLKEIGAMLSPAVGKSGVNHRLRKISFLAENLRGGKL